MKVWSLGKSTSVGPTSRRPPRGLWHRQVCGKEDLVGLQPSEARAARLGSSETHTCYLCPPPIHFSWVFLFIWHPRARHYHANSQMLPPPDHVAQAGFIPARKLSHWATWKKPLTWQGPLSQRWSGVSSQHLKSSAHISVGWGGVEISMWLQLTSEMGIKEVGGYGRAVRVGWRKACTFLKQQGANLLPIGPWLKELSRLRTVL